MSTAIECAATARDAARNQAKARAHAFTYGDTRKIAKSPMLAAPYGCSTCNDTGIIIMAGRVREYELCPRCYPNELDQIIDALTRCTELVTALGGPKIGKKELDEFAWPCVVVEKPTNKINCHQRRMYRIKTYQHKHVYLDHVIRDALERAFTKPTDRFHWVQSELDCPRHDGTVITTTRIFLGGTE